MCDNRFYICKHCGNLVGMINNSGVPMICCGEAMTEIKPNTMDASLEKHVPVVKTVENVVTVDIGSISHPMTADHYIQWVYLQSEKGGQRKCLKAGETPKVTFCLDNDKAIAVFAFCNLHGLWKTDIR